MPRSRAPGRGWCSSAATQASESRRWWASCTRRLSRHEACSPQASSISSSATFRTPPWLRPFESLIRQLLAKPEAELTEWREQLRQALNPNGALVIDLIPELKFVIGEQPPVPDVPPAAAKARVQMTLRRLIGVFARAEHPLALFLDDLQWLDGATLDLLENILVEPEPQHLLLVGAYRDNEVDAAHPLMRKLSAIRESGAMVQEVVLGPLEHEDLTQWFAEALHCPPERAMPLAQLVHEKTAGNPFFANQFLQELVADDLITFEASDAEWRWDLGPIRAKGYTENVVDLMVGKLSRLPLTTQEALKALACLGNTAEHVNARAGSRYVRGAAPLRSLGSAPAGADRPFGRLVPIRARPCPGGGLFARFRSSSVLRSISGSAGSWPRRSHPSDAKRLCSRSSVTSTARRPS